MDGLGNKDLMGEPTKTRKTYSHVVYAVLSVASPFIAYFVITIYQGYSYEWYWQIMEKQGQLDDADINAGAMMSFVIVVEILFAVGIGSLVGIIFASVSIKKNPRLVSFGTLALLFNLAPFLGLAFL